MFSTQQYNLGTFLIIKKKIKTLIKLNIIILTRDNALNSHFIASVWGADSSLVENK